MGSIRTCLGLLLIAGTSWSQQYVISTIAGGAPPPTPAPALTVSIGNTLGTALDTAGNLYFTSINCVFKLDLNGVVTLIAGTSRLGYSGDGGAATLAQLAEPIGLAVDSAGNIFVADLLNNRVRKISNGIITTVAGKGGYGNSGDGGPATSAQLSNPNSVAVDSHGNLFIADYGANRIREVSASGTITAFAGTGTAGFSGDGGLAASAELAQPQFVAVDSQGNVFFSDTGNNRVRKVSANGTITTLAGNGTAGFAGDNGPAANAELQGPQGVAVDSAGNVFIVDAANYRVREVSAGTITTVAGNGGDGATGDGGPATSALVNGGYGISVNSAGDLFIASYYRENIRKISGGIINTVAGSGVVLYSGDNGAAPSAQMSAPTGVAVDSSGNVFIADSTNRVRKVGSNGIITTVAGNGACCGGVGSGVPALGPNVSPTRVAVDASGNLFIADFFAAIRKVSASGTITTVAGNGTGGFAGDGGPATSAQLANSPGGLTIDSSGNIFIADTANNRVRKVSSGIITTVAGNGTSGFSGDSGLATAAQLAQPMGLAVDSSGNLYIADTGNNRIRKVTPGGIISTFAGTNVAAFSGDNGQAVNAELQRPEGVAVDGQGNVFIADTTNARVRKVSSNGVITTVAGINGYGHMGDCGPATNATLSYLSDLTLDSSGNILIADTNNNAVRRLQPTTQPTLLCAVADAAGENTGPVSPGKIVVLYGTGMGASTLSLAAPTNGIFGSQLAGTSVSVNGNPAPLIYAESGQISAIVPYGTTSATAQFTVSYQGQSSSFTMPVAASAPSLFTTNNAGYGEAAAVNIADSNFNSVTPVAIGDYIELFATGEGQTVPAGVDGKEAPLMPTPATPLPMPVQNVTVTIGGLPTSVIYAGAVPGVVAGLMQIDALIPTGVTPGSQVPVVVQVGNAVSSPAVWISVSAK